MDVQITQPSKVELFTQVFQHIKLFTDHINITFREEGLYIQTMDSSHVSVFELNLPNTWFDHYVLKEGNVLLGIHSSILYKILHSRDKAHTISLSMTDRGDDKLNIDFDTDTSDVYNRHYEISLTDIDMDQLHIPDMEYEADLTLPSITFGNLVDQFKMFGDTLEIHCSEENVGLSANSNETGKMTVDIPIDDIISFAIEEGENLHLSFSLNHLHNICCYSKIAQNMDIGLKRDCPIKITYQLGEDNCYITFYLAPKINE
jgi:proliferating cell nuclear antigen